MKLVWDLDKAEYLQMPEDTDEMAMKVIHLPTKTTPVETLVGVYGTLKKNYSNHSYFLTNAKYMGDAFVDGLLFHKGNFPMLVAQPTEVALRQGMKIKVEVYKVTADQLEKLDRLEGVHSGHYERRSVGTLELGLVDCYFGPTRREWVGMQHVIWEGKWRGSEQTPYVEVDFGDGSVKPKVRFKAGMVIDKETGEVKFAKPVDLAGEELIVTDIRPPTTAITNVPATSLVSSIKDLFKKKEPEPYKPPFETGLVTVKASEELLGFSPKIMQI